MRDSAIAINLVGILTESGAQTFDAVQARGAETIAKAAAAAGSRMVHVSAIGADEKSASYYARAKAAGAKIERPLADTEYGSREYSARDCDGHLWSFGTYDPYAES